MENANLINELQDDYGYLITIDNDDDYCIHLHYDELQELLQKNKNGED